MMTSKFFLSYKQLNLVFLTLEKREEIIQQTELQEIEAVQIFEYRKIMMVIEMELIYINK